MHRSLLLSSALFGLAVAACSGSGSGSPSAPSAGQPPSAPMSARSDLARAPASDVPTATLDAVVEADNAFTFDIYEKVRQGHGDRNVVLSPLSVSLALSMAYAGAQSQTKTEMAGALHFGAGLDAHAGQNALSQALASRAEEAFVAAQENAKEAMGEPPSAEDYRLHVVNSVWGDGSYTWEKPFLDTLATNYGAGVFLADFLGKPDAERARINAWVSGETRDKINDLIPPDAINQDTRLVLVNAVHLKLPWASPFHAEGTKAGAFKKGDGATVTADFMSKQQSFSYFEDDTMQLAALPLAGRKVSMVVMRPKAGLAALEDALDAATWKSAWQGRRSQEVALELPKFSFTSESISVADAMRSLGMVQAFDPDRADFYGMCAAPPKGERLFVSDIVHKAMMAIDENGVEAAAATAVLMAGTTSVPPEPVTMVVDEPFMVAIVDEPTGALLFLGHIQDPTVEGSP